MIADKSKERKMEFWLGQRFFRYRGSFCVYPFSMQHNYYCFLLEKEKNILSCILLTLYLSISFLRLPDLSNRRPNALWINAAAGWWSVGRSSVCGFSSSSYLSVRFCSWTITTYFRQAHICIVWEYETKNVYPIKAFKGICCIYARFCYVGFLVVKFGKNFNEVESLVLINKFFQ